MVGEPFTGELSPTFAGFGGAPLPNPPLSLWTLTTLFGNAKPLHDELKLTEDQVKRLTAFRPGGTPTRAGLDAEQSALEQGRETEKALAAFLTPEQVQRYRQVILQQ